MGELRTARAVSACLISAACAGFLGIVGAVYLRESLAPFFMSRPSINAMIVGLGLWAFVGSFLEMGRAFRQARILDDHGVQLFQESRPQPMERIDEIGGGIVRNRAQTLTKLHASGASSSETAAILADADAIAEEARGSFSRFIVGVLVFLGLIGAFWGVLITITGVEKVLGTLDPERVEDVAAFVSQLKNSMSGLLGGLATSFSTSLFGLAGSVFLGFIDLQARKARMRLLSDLDRLSLSAPWLRPTPARPELPEAPPPQSPGYQQAHLPYPTDLRYLTAVQETVSNNLKELGEILSRQAVMDEKITASLVEMKGLLESIEEDRSHNRDILQQGHAQRQGLLERMDTVGRRVEQLVREVRVSRESSEDADKALLDRIKLEGELTNKTLSIGFSDLMRGRDASRERRTPSGSGEETK